MRLAIARSRIYHIPCGLRIDLAKAEADVEASLAKRHYYRAEAPEKLAAASLSPAL